jgi:hypothetical protein
MKVLLQAAVLTLIALPAFSAEIVNRQGGKCLSAEGGLKDGARIVAYNCTGAKTENFVVEGGRLKIAGSTWCAQSDNRNEKSEIRLRRCVSGDSGHKLQNFDFNANTIGHNTGFCLDTKVGIGQEVATMISWAHQPTVLAKCSGLTNQNWYTGTFKSGQTLASIADGTTFWVPGVAGMFEKRGDTVITGDKTATVSAEKIIAKNGGKIVQSN